MDLSALFLVVLRGAVNGLASVARLTQNPYDDLVASFLQSLLQDPAGAARKLQMFQSLQPHLNEAVSRAAAESGNTVGSPGRMGMTREEVEALGDEGSGPSSRGGMRTQDPVKHQV